MKKLVIFCFCAWLANCLATPIIPNTSEYIKVELKTDAENLKNNSGIIVDDEKLNLKEYANNDQSAKIGLLNAILQRIPALAPGSLQSGNSTWILNSLIHKLRPTTTTAATTLSTSSTESTTTTTTTTPTTTTTTPTTTTTTPTTTTTTTPTTTTTTTPTTTTTTTPITTTTPTTTPTTTVMPG